MTLLATTELEAVNKMLAAIAEAPVSTITDDTIDDALIARDTLREVSKEIQSAGWNFNTEYDFPISVDGDLKLPYPATAAHADPMDSEARNLVKRGDYFWDQDNRTFVYSAGTAYKFKVVWLLDFEDLPLSFRTWISIRAARRFTEQQLGDEGAVKFSRDEEMEAKAKALADDLRRGDNNILTRSRSANRVVSRRNSYYWR